MDNPRADRERAAYDLLVAKHRDDPGWFMENMPEVAELIEDRTSTHRQPRPSFSLTRREREYHLARLSEIVATKPLDSGDAVAALEHCATLIRGKSLPYEIDHKTLRRLFSAAFGKAVSSYRKETTLEVRVERNQETAHRVSLVRGVVLNLNTAMRLVSVSVTPRKVRERRKMMEFVSVGRDTEGDVAERHDSYLAKVDPHGRA